MIKLKRGGHLLIVISAASRLKVPGIVPWNANARFALQRQNKKAFHQR